MTVGIIKNCVNCGKNSYTKPEIEICPYCNEIFHIKKTKNPAPEVIVYLGTQELNRRAIIDIEKRGY